MEVSPRTTEVLLFQGADYDQYVSLLAATEQAGNAARRAENVRAGDGPDVTAKAAVVAAAAAFDEFVAEASERAVTVVLKALGRRGWRDMLALHPAREDHPLDAMRGFNVDTLCDDLVPASVANDFPSIAHKNEFLDALPISDWNRLYAAALALNEDEGPDPKVLLSSLVDGM